jgi:MoaA/NifB/PqqE/SkfB family radical SAM enzyme
MDLIIKPTQRCNFKCSFCSSTNIAKSNNKKDDLDINNIFIFLKRFPDTKNIIVNGGDPLVMSVGYYEDLISYIEKNNLNTRITLVTNLWDYYLNPDKWRKLLKNKIIHVATSFNLGETRKITTTKVFTKEIFLNVVKMFKSDFGYVPSFISVISEQNKDTAIDNVLIAKELNAECKLNYAFSSGRESVCFPIGKMYNIYLDIYELGLQEFEYNTKQMLRRLNGEETTTCPQNRKCDEGIRNLQPTSNNGYNYSSCGSFGDDQEYGIDFEKEMEGDFFKPLQSALEIQYQKEECLSCPNFNICNGCYKTVSDLKKNNLVEESCKEMKRFRKRAIDLKLIKY